MTSSRILLSLTLAISHFLFPTILTSQFTSSGVPFLTITTSVESNGMGGVSYGMPSTDPNLFFRNAGLVGFNALETYAATSHYTTKTSWLHQFGIKDLNYFNNSYFAGCDIGQLVSTPMPIGLGFSYHLTRLNLGQFFYAPQSPPLNDSWEDVKTYSVGIAFEAFVKVGVGYGWSTIRSNLASADTSDPFVQAKVQARRWGMFVQVPFGKLFQPEQGPGMVGLIADLNFGYAMNNVGGAISYGDIAQSDPLPRTVGLGYSAQVGFDVDVGEGRFPLAGVSYGHDIDDVLIERNAASWKYTSGFQDINIIDNVLLGKGNTRAHQHTGLEIQIFGILSHREGRWGGEGYPEVIQTSGLGVRASAIFRFVHLALKDNVSGFLADHVEIRYDRARYIGESLLSGTPFEGVVVQIR